MKFNQQAGFDLIEIEAPAGSPAYVVLHGYGADYRDLAPLALEIPTERPYHWYFVNAPFPCPGLEAFGGRMWFPIDMAGLQQAIARDQFREFFNSAIPSGLLEARAQIKQLLLELKQRHTHLVVGGFSQGAMVASLTALELGAEIDGLTILSGTFVAPSLWSDLVSGGVPFPIFQSHGSADPVLPVAEARRLRDFLLQAGVELEYSEFQGGHQIPFEVMERLGSFLSRLCPAGER